jgi:hypothetical protein
VTLKNNIQLRTELLKSHLSGTVSVYITSMCILSTDPPPVCRLESTEGFNTRLHAWPIAMDQYSAFINSSVRTECSKYSCSGQFGAAHNWIFGIDEKESIFSVIFLVFREGSEKV